MPPIPLALVEQVAVSQGIDRRALACCLDLLRIASTLQASQDHWLEDQGLSPSKFSILAALADRDGLSPSRLAQHLGVRRPTLTGLLDNLQAQGLISRQHTEQDRRRWSVHLSPSGRTLAQQAVTAQLTRMAGAMTPLSVSERSALRKILQNLLPSDDHATVNQATNHG